MSVYAKFPAVLGGGVVIAAVSLSQLLAIGALSVTPLGREGVAFGVVASFFTATVGALCAMLISRAAGEVTGPRTSISVIYVALCVDRIARAGGVVDLPDIVAALSLAVVLMGLLELLAGWARIGEVVRFLPHPVNAGFMTGIGLLIAWSQVGTLFGLEGALARYDWRIFLEHWKPGALLLGVASAVTVWLAPRITKRVQPLLAGLVVGAALYHAAGFFVSPDALGPTLGTISPLATFETSVTQAWNRVTLHWLIETAVEVFPFATFLALQGILNAAVAATPLAEATGARANVNRTLVSQGVANVLSGMLAGLPLGTSPSVSMIAARMTGVAAAVPAASMIILLVSVFVFAPILALIPLAVLAGLLVTTGLGMIDTWTRGLVANVVRGGGSRRDLGWNLAVVATVAGAFFFGSVPLALLVGSVVAMIVLAVSLSVATEFITQDGSQIASTRVWPPEQTDWLIEARSTMKVLRPIGGLFFGTADALIAQLAAIRDPVRYCVIDCSGLTVLDATGCQKIAAGARSLAARGITTVLAGLDLSDPADAALVPLGLTAPAPKSHWFHDLDHALEWVERECLRSRWPEGAADKPVELADTQLAQRLSPEDLAVLQSHLAPVGLEAGTMLFRRGAAGDSLYVIASGLIEIRVSTDLRGARGRRLAALGPGCIFGDIALVTSGPRTADAVCVKAARLYELRRDSLRDIESRFPQVYARIMTNLNVHLARSMSRGVLNGEGVAAPR